MQTKSKYIKLGIVLALALGALLLGIFHALSFGVSYTDESVHTVFIETEEDIRAMGGSFHNNICYLANDITVSELSALASERHPFVGVFDGQGHTVTLTGEAALKSFFGYIGEGGVVRTLRIVVESAALTTRATRSVCASLALKNEGLVENCRVTVKELSVELRGHYGAMVGINYGTVRYSFAEANFVGNMPAEERASSGKLLLSAGVAYNYGTVDTLVASVTYRNIDEANGNLATDASNPVQNRGVGAAVANNYEGGCVENTYVLIETGTYLHDVHVDPTVQASTDPDSIYSIALLFDTLNFDENVWILRNREPVFIQGD